MIADPPPVETTTLPDVDRRGTVTSSNVDDLHDICTAETPLNVTLIGEMKLLPVILSLLPIGPDEIEIEATVGNGLIVKERELAVVPSVLDTVILPEVASAGIVAVIFLSVTTAKVAAVPLKDTDVVPVKAEPLMVIVSPSLP